MKSVYFIPNRSNGPPNSRLLEPSGMIMLLSPIRLSLVRNLATNEQLLDDTASKCIVIP